MLSYHTRSIIIPAFLFLLMSVLLLLGSCQRQPDLPPGRWRVVVEVPGGELPFLMEISRTEDAYEGYLVNGRERVKIEEIQQQGSNFTFAMSTFNSTISGELDGDQLVGTLRLIKGGGKVQEMPLTASFNQDYRFFDSPVASGVVVDGRWAVNFTDAEGTVTPAVGEFQQEGKQVFGTFLTETGDYRFLEGEVRDSSLFLSCFDGAHVFLFKARMTANQTLEGEFWSGTAWHETWKASRDANASLRDPFKLTYLKDPDQPLDFAFPDVNGELLSLSDSRFAGKVVWVMLAGSWCPNCHDEARYMSEFYKRHSDRGLEMIGLMYEHYDDFERAVRQINKFAAKYDIQYPLLFAGSSDKAKASHTLPMLNRVISYPTLIMIDRQRRVRYIHTGFTGPGTGEHFERLTAHIESLADSMLGD